MTAPPIRILVVDDEPVLRVIIARVLRDAGYETVAVHSAEEALAVLEATMGAEVVVADATLGDRHGDRGAFLSTPSGAGGWAVVSDVRLPHMNGCALGREIVRRWPGVRLLFISGYIADDLLARRICPRNLPLLPKPFAPPELLEAIEATLQREPWRPGEWPDPEGGFDAVHR